MRRAASALLLALAIVGSTSCASAPQATDDYTLVADTNLLTDHAAHHADGTINVVVEIPTGTTAKWEVDKSDGALRWEIKNGEPRIVKYLGYPGNYGMVPRTLLAKDDGGDGDPLDVLVLGDAIERGRVVRVRLIGVLELLDGGEQDDKLIAVVDGSPLGAATDIEDLDRRFPGVTSIVRTWFTHYKGPGEIEARGWAGAADARAVLERAAASFEARTPTR